MAIAALVLRAACYIPGICVVILEEMANPAASSLAEFTHTPVKRVSIVALITRRLLPIELDATFTAILVLIDTISHLLATSLKFHTNISNFALKSSN